MDSCWVGQSFSLSQVKDVDLAVAVDVARRRDVERCGIGRTPRTGDVARCLYHLAKVSDDGHDVENVDAAVLVDVAPLQIMSADVSRITVSTLPVTLAQAVGEIELHTGPLRPCKSTWVDC